MTTVLGPVDFATGKKMFFCTRSFLESPPAMEYRVGSQSVTWIRLENTFLN